MIQTGPKENYCFTEVGREIIGGNEFLAKLSVITAAVLGVHSVAALTELQLMGDEVTNLELEHSVQPVVQTVGCEIPPSNELRLPLLHRGFSVEYASRYPDTTYIKSKLKKGLRGEFAAIAERHGQTLEGTSVWFDRASYLPSPGHGIILGLMPKEDHATTEVLKEQASAAAQYLRTINKTLYKLEQPWNLAMAVARIEVNKNDYSAQRLIEQIMPRLNLRLKLGQVKFSSDDLAAE